jgi:hypothetical protein
MYTFKVSQEDYRRALYDAEASKDSLVERYGKRNQNSVDKIIQDMSLGLSFELGAVYPFLCGIFGEDNVEEPYVYDGTNILKEEFTHNADIVVGEKLNFHCKVMEKNMARTYGYGWTFQKNYIEKNETKMLNSENDFVVFGSIDKDTLDAEIMIVQAFSVLYKQGLFEAPIRRQLKNNKLVVKNLSFSGKKVERKIDLTTLKDKIVLTEEKI